MTTITPEELKAQSEQAMKAQEAIKATLAEQGKKLEKLDALDVDSLKKMQEDVLKGIDIGQKARL